MLDRVSAVLLCSGNCTVNIDPDRTDGILGFQMQVLVYIWKHTVANKQGR